MKTTAEERRKLRRERQALEEEIADEYAMPLDMARELAKAALPELLVYAREWDAMVEASRLHTVAMA